MAVGGALFSALGRGLLWTTVTTFRAPVTTGLLVCMTLGTAYAATNALYFQTVRHPAPMFSTDSNPAPKAPVKTSQRTATRAPEPTASISRQPSAQSSPATKPSAATSQPKAAPVPAVPEAVAEIGNADVKLLQQKLTVLGFYEGDADGYYGPRTAAAIRKFEASVGMDPKGALTPEVLARITGTKVTPTQEDSSTAPVTPVVSKPEPVASVAPSEVEKLAQAVVDRSIPETARRTPPAPVAETATATSTPANSRSSDPLMQIVHKVADTAHKAVTRPASTDTRYVEQVQRGLASLGFLQGKIDGVAGADTARAIRNFEVYYNYKVTGEVSPELVELLEQAGAQI